MKNAFSLSPARLTHSFIVIYFLNCLDLIFTFTYIKTGVFFEVNPFIRQFIHNPYLCCLVKIVIPGLLIGYLCMHTDQIASSHYRIYQLGVLLLFVIYLTIDAMHLYYLLVLLNPYLMTSLQCCCTLPLAFS